MHCEEAEWRAWRPAEAASRYAGLEAPWAIAAGWAINLFVGEERRVHEDIEIAVPAGRFSEVAARLGDLELWVPVGGGTLQPADEATLAGSQQTWALDRDAKARRIDVFREPSAGGEWVCRRDARIRLPYAELTSERNPAIWFRKRRGIRLRRLEALTE